MANFNAGGNRRKSRAEHERTGTFRKDRHAELRNPEPETGAPDAPDGLSEGAQHEWTRMIARLGSCGSLFKVDDAAIYQYCRLFDETERIAVAQEHLELAVERLEENLSDFQGEDFLKLAQELTQQRKLIAKCTDQLRAGRMAIRQYLVEFGLTPASRGRVKLPAKTQEVDEFTAFQRKRGVA